TRQLPMTIKPALAKLLFGIVLGATALPSHAQPIDEQALRVYLQDELSGSFGRADITIGDVDPRLHMAPCARIEPFLPAGARLWGRGMVGVRCVEGASW